MNVKLGIHNEGAITRSRRMNRRLAMIVWVGWSQESQVRKRKLLFPRSLQLLQAALTTTLGGPGGSAVRGLQLCDCYEAHRAMRGHFGRTILRPRDGVMGPQANRSPISAYLSTNLFIPLIPLKYWDNKRGLPLLVGGYTRMFETGHALDYGLAFAHPSTTPLNSV